MTTAGGLSSELVGATLVLTLSRPHAANAVDTALAKSLISTLQRVEDDESIRSLVIRGSGTRFFCAGGDLREYGASLSEGDLREQFERMQAACRLLEASRLPTLAAITGDAVGGGVELALACDIRICYERASLWLPQVSLGLVTGWGAHGRLVRAVGEAWALDLLLTGRTLAAQEALELGLVTRVSATPAEAAIELAQELNSRPSTALSAMKRIVRRSSWQTAEDGQGDINEEFIALWRSNQEAIQSALD